MQIVRDNGFFQVAAVSMKPQKLLKWMNVKTSAVILSLTDQFSRQGILTILLTDKGPQYYSEELKGLCEDSDIIHHTSSAHIPH